MHSIRIHSRTSTKEFPVTVPKARCSVQSELIAWYNTVYRVRKIKRWPGEAVEPTTTNWLTTYEVSIGVTRIRWGRRLDFCRSRSSLARTFNYFILYLVLAVWCLSWRFFSVFWNPLFREHLRTYSLSRLRPHHAFGLLFYISYFHSVPQRAWYHFKPIGGEGSSCCRPQILCSEGKDFILAVISPLCCLFPFSH